MPQQQGGRFGRETRLLLTTIVVSVGMLLLLARFRFPQDSTITPDEPAAPPLERLAARATFDELASIMADLNRRLSPRIAVVRVQPDRAGGPYAVAPRLTDDRAVVLLAANEGLAPSGTDGVPPIVGRETGRDLAVIGVTPRADSAVTPRIGAPRPGPRYVAVVEGTAQGPALRPVYVGRTDLFQDPRTSMSVLAISAVQHSLPRGAAIFSLDGTFIGLASESGATTTIIPAESLRAVAQSAQAVAQARGDLGLDVQTLTNALARAAGVDRGVMVNHVARGGPADENVSSGDVIQAVDGTNVTTVVGFQQLEQTRIPGAPVVLTIVRRGKPLQVTVRAADTALASLPAAGDDPGMVLRTVRGAGVEVVTVAPGSAAADAGVEAGDLIVAADGVEQPAAGAIERAYRTAPRGGSVLLTIRRGLQHRVVAVEKL
jgi:S1-C subfamily serine protease